MTPISVGPTLNKEHKEFRNTCCAVIAIAKDRNPFVFAIGHNITHRKRGDTKCVTQIADCLWRILEVSPQATSGQQGWLRHTRIGYCLIRFNRQIGWIRIICLGKLPQNHVSSIRFI